MKFEVLMTVTVWTAVIWVGMPHSLIDNFLENVGIYLPYCMMSHSIRQ
jgi:hypothetical protein